MARRDFRRGAAAISQRRLTRWLDLIPVITGFTTTGSAIMFSLTTAEKALRPFTIVRTRLQIGIVSDQVIATEEALGAVGVAVVSDQAEAIGITAVPTPTTDMASDLWLVHQIIMTGFTFASGVGISEPGFFQYSVDSKAMRKVQDGEDVVVVAEGNSASTGGFNLVVGGRMLVKLN